MTGFTVALNSTFVLLIPAATIILSRLSGQISYEETVLDFLFYALFTPVCTTMMNRIMFASEQLMAAKSAVSRVEAVIQEKTLPESCTEAETDRNRNRIQKRIIQLSESIRESP